LVVVKEQTVSPPLDPLLLVALVAVATASDQQAVPQEHLDKGLLEAMVLRPAVTEVAVAVVLVAQEVTPVVLALGMVDKDCSRL
jgi:hypothetical protein